MQNKKTAQLIQRISAGIMDLVIAFIISTFLSSLIISPLFTNMEDYKSNYEIYETKLVETNLFKKDSNNSNKLTCIIDLLDEQGKTTFSLDKVEEYDSVIVLFYTEYGEEKVTEYHNTKKDYSIFTYSESESKYVLVDNPSINEVYTFFMNSYNDAANYFFEVDEEAYKSYYYLTLMNKISLITTIGITLLICYIIIPLLSKDGQTIAKRIFALDVRSIKDDAPASKIQVLFREAFYVFIVLILSYFTYFIPLIISLGFMIFERNNLSLHDYVSGTYVRDLVLVVPEEEREYNENIIDVEAREVN